MDSFKVKYSVYVVSNTSVDIHSNSIVIPES